MQSSNADAKTYDVSKYPRPSVTADIIVFTVQQKDLQVLLVKRNVWPFKDHWALPGGFVKLDESLDEAAKRELVEETGVKDIYLEQLYTFGDPKRDPRTRVITVAYFALIRADNIALKSMSDAREAQWVRIAHLPQVAFDHKQIIHYALQRLRWKLEYTTIGFQLLPKKFTLSQVQEAYEIIFGKQFDKRNFRKKILSLGIIQETKELTPNVSHRPARMYTLKKPVGEIIEIL